MSAAHLEARRKAGLSTADPTYACSDAIRTSKETAKRSVARMSDKDPKNKEKELGLNTQLEKRSFAAHTMNVGFREIEPNLCFSSFHYIEVGSALRETNPLTGNRTFDKS